MQIWRSPRILETFRALGKDRVRRLANGAARVGIAARLRQPPRRNVFESPGEVATGGSIAHGLDAGAQVRDAPDQPASWLFRIPYPLHESARTTVQ